MTFLGSGASTLVVRTSCSVFGKFYNILNHQNIKNKLLLTGNSHIFRFADEELASLLEDIQTKRSFQY